MATDNKSIKEKLQESADIIAGNPLVTMERPGYSPEQINSYLENQVQMLDMDDEDVVFGYDEFGRGGRKFTSIMKSFGASMLDYSAGLAQGGEAGLNIGKGMGKGLVLGTYNAIDGILAPINEATNGSIDSLDSYLKNRPMEYLMNKYLPDEDLGASGMVSQEFAKLGPGIAAGWNVSGWLAKGMFLRTMAASVLAPYFYGAPKTPNMATMLNDFMDIDPELSNNLADTIIQWADTEEEQDVLKAKIKTVVSDGPFDATIGTLLHVGALYRYLRNNPEAATGIAGSFGMIADGVLKEDAVGRFLNQDGQIEISGNNTTGEL